MTKIAGCDQAGIAEAVHQLQNPGNVLLVPTETVYGLVCAWDDPVARAGIYELKHRAENKPFAAFLPDLDRLPQEVDSLPDAAIRIASAFCPGPLTLIVPDKNGSTFGFRIPDHPFILELLRAFGKPLASTSANLSGNPPALSVQQGLADIDGEVALAIDGGVLPSDSKASTIILVNRDSTWKILRPGPVTEEMIRDVMK